MAKKELLKFKLLGAHGALKRGDEIELTLEDSKRPVFANKLVPVVEQKKAKTGKKEVEKDTIEVEESKS